MYIFPFCNDGSMIPISSIPICSCLLLFVDRATISATMLLCIQAQLCCTDLFNSTVVNQIAS
ncbi:hypothetical protein BDV32DRAFT_83523 [Aspergillus pseudonomiae]|nr:hypothetical protein BDV32DRAFT_83523 [Aspergillus pseudonomiae]